MQTTAPGRDWPLACRADRHEDVAVVLAIALAGYHRGLGGRGERDPGRVGVDRPDALEQVLPGEGDLQVVAVEARLEDLGGLCLFRRPRLQYQLASAEGKPDRGVAFGHERDPL